jgi:hypothetical protein
MPNEYLEIFLKKNGLRSKKAEQILYNLEPLETIMSKMDITGGGENQIQGGEDESGSNTPSPATKGLIGRTTDSIATGTGKLLSPVGKGLGMAASAVGSVAVSTGKGALSGVETVVDATNYGVGKSLKTIYNVFTKTSPENALAKRIIKSIQNALKIVNKDMDASEEDIKRVKQLKIVNQIDMNFGGGLLMFDKEFKMNQIIHMFYSEKKPYYISLPVGKDILPNDILNQNLVGNKIQYDVMAISGMIQNM